MVRTFEPTNIHTAKLVDLPMMRRLTEYGIPLDSALLYTGENPASSGGLLSSILGGRGVYTLVGRAGRNKVVGQFRLRADLPLAHMTFLATAADDDSALLHLLDAAAVEAGRRGAHMLTAEVDEDSPLFETLRAANFSVYARHTLWRWMGERTDLHGAILPLDELTRVDPGELHTLYATLVPRLIQPVAVPPEDADGWVYRAPQGGLRAYIAYSEGRGGGYVVPFVDHTLPPREMQALMRAVLMRAKADRQPLVVCLRRYQESLEPALDALGFVPERAQALMVRHIAAGIRHARFVETAEMVAAMPRAVRPPSRTPCAR
jgi:hypothetical protein